eukprot:m.117683 g.117683  ORF g.117683 m.117683 type:complete len:623 (+) comp37623_c0_seq1:257-2125(+)
MSTVFFLMTIGIGCAVSLQLRNHPRLIADDGQLTMVEQFINNDKNVESYYKQVTKHGMELLSEPLLKHTIKPGDAHLLLVSRAAVDRVYTWSLLYRLTENSQWSDRCIKELLNLVSDNFTDWSPSHFLDTGEMTHAVGLGFDWLYPELSPSQRQMIVKGIVEKGFGPAQKAYADNEWWTRNTGTNWNLVCNGGMIVGSLAIMDEPEAKDIAVAIFHNATSGIVSGFETYQDDGSWIEGPGYWSYATRYGVTAMASLLCATGNDLGFSEREGVKNTGRWLINNIGPTGLFFNHGDEGEHEELSDEPSLLWFSNRYKDPLYGYYGRLAANATSDSVDWNVPRWKDVLFYSPLGSTADLVKQTLESSYMTQDGFFRTSWTDPEATFVGFRGGDNAASHAHYDLGTFVYDTMGERFAMDLGSDNYSMPAYFGHLRGTYYRCMTQGHNTLNFDHLNQVSNAKAKIIHFNASQSESGMSFAVIDLTNGYKNATGGTVMRGIALLKDTNQFVIRDEISKPALNQSHSIYWSMHTMADVSIDEESPSAAHLSSNGKTISVAIVHPEGTKMSSEDVDLKPPQESTKGIRKIEFGVSGKSSQFIVVSLGPEGNKPVKTNPLSQWPKDGPIQE